MRLQELPASLVSLSQLRILKVGHNKLVSLPPNFGSLKSLEILDLTGNRLNETVLTKDFFQLSSLLSSPPTSTIERAVLDRLRALYLADNLFEKFADEHLDQFHDLQIVSNA